MEKFTLDGIKIVLSHYGFKVLDSIYINQRKHLNCLCSNGHSLKRSWNKFKQDFSCPLCSLAEKNVLKLSKIRDAFVKKGYTLLSTKYINNKTELVYRCSLGHTSTITWNNFIKGSTCALCSYKSRSGDNSTLWQGGVFKKNLPLYKTYASKLASYQQNIYKVESEGLILLGVKCKNCNNIFVPTRTALNNRIKAINNVNVGEAHLYCSDKCKDSCKVYYFNSFKMIDPDSAIFKEKQETDKARNCQTNHLKQLQLDEVGYNYCEKCGKVVTSVDLHHTLEIAKYGLAAINSAGHILLCRECHKYLTKQCR